MKNSSHLLNKCWAIILPKSRNNGRALIISSFHFKATRGFIYLSKNGIIKPKIFHSIPISVAKHLGNVFPCTLTFIQKNFFFWGGGSGNKTAFCLLRFNGGGTNFGNMCKTKHFHFYPETCAEHFRGGNIFLVCV